MRFVCAALLLLLPHAVRAQKAGASGVPGAVSAGVAEGGRVDLRAGDIVLIAGYTHRPLRGTDSYPGSFVRRDSTFRIDYDIGGMAGTQMHPGRRSECIWFIEHQVDGRPAYTGVFMDGSSRRIATTIHVLGGPRRVDPANFQAEIRSEQDVAEFMLIAASYRARVEPVTKR